MYRRQLAVKVALELHEHSDRVARGDVVLVVDVKLEVDVRVPVAPLGYGLQLRVGHAQQLGSIRVLHLNQPDHILHL